MLPPGHVAAGFLTAEALLKIAKPDLSQTQLHQLVYWGMFFSFAPDLDMFYAFFKERALTVQNPNNIHRKFYSHAPILWLVAGLLIYFLAPSVYIKLIGLLLWLGSWSHFLLDSIEYGVMWLWPFNSQVWALKDRGVKEQITGKNFFEYWMNFLKYYSTRWTFYFEILIFFIAIIVIINK